MREYRHKTIATLVLVALGLAACLYFNGISSVGASGQGDSGAVGKGLGDAKPINVEARPDKVAHGLTGWKLFLVGTNTYDNLSEQYDLHYAVKDVESLQRRFIQLGVPEENIILLTSQRGASRSNQKNIQKYFNDFISDLAPNDSAFVYLSGHGFRFARDERAYYAPTDLDLDDIRASGVSIDDMIARLKGSRAKFKWMTVDACRNDPMNDSSVKGKSLPTGVTSACIVNPSDLPDAFVFMQGCANGQCSLEALELEQGLLTYSLLEALQCDDNPAALNKDSGELEFIELINYVQKRTQELSRRCVDSSNSVRLQQPRVTCAQLPSFTLLTNLRRDDLTSEQCQRITAEVRRFKACLSQKDLTGAETSLKTLADLYPKGIKSEQYQTLQQELTNAKRKQEAEEFYANAQQALKSKEYASAKTYIDGAIERYDDPKYTTFRNGALTVAVTAAVNQAIFDREYQKAKSLNRILAELGAETVEVKESLLYTQVGNWSGVHKKLTIVVLGLFALLLAICIITWAARSGVSGHGSNSGELQESISAVEAPQKTMNLNAVGPSVPNEDLSKANEAKRALSLEQTTPTRMPLVSDCNDEGISQEQSVRKAGDLMTLTIAGVKVNFCWAPAGTFLMGSPESEEGRLDTETQHKVELTRGFWIAETPTTQELWKAVKRRNPSCFKGSNQLPVECVSWKDCSKFVKKLNKSHCSVLPNGYRYALPTEAQWEYACRAGTTTPFSFGSALNGDKANCDGNYPYGTDTKGSYRKQTTPVKSYEPNPWGVYDMHGNLFEWASDWYGSYDTSSSTVVDPAGLSVGSFRVLRGGSWYSSSDDCRSAGRNYYGPSSCNHNIGFRLVLIPR